MAMYRDCPRGIEHLICDSLRLFVFSDVLSGSFFRPVFELNTSIFALRFIKLGTRVAAGLLEAEKC
jgi:hypothetical protein